MVLCRVSCVCCSVTQLLCHCDRVSLLGVCWVMYSMSSLIKLHWIGLLCDGVVEVEDEMRHRCLSFSMEGGEEQCRVL